MSLLRIAVSPELSPLFATPLACHSPHKTPRGRLWWQRAPPRPIFYSVPYEQGRGRGLCGVRPGSAWLSHSRGNPGRNRSERHRSDRLVPGKPGGSRETNPRGRPVVPGTGHCSCLRSRVAHGHAPVSDCAAGGPCAQARRLRRGPEKVKPSHPDASWDQGADGGHCSSRPDHQATTAPRHHSGCAPLSRRIHEAAVTFDQGPTNGSFSKAVCKSLILR